MNWQDSSAGQSFGGTDQGQASSARIGADGWAVGFSLLALGVMLCALLIVILFSNLPLNLDCAVYLNCARQLLRGGVPYVDFVDNNPPMAFYVHVLPAFVADRFVLDQTIVFHLMVAALIAYSAAMLFSLLLRLYPKASNPVLLMVTGTWIFFSVYIVCFGWFGEREQLFILAYVPFLFCRLARHLDVDVGRASAAVIGTVLGPFVLLKPHFCVIALAGEAWMLFRTRRFAGLVRPEVILVVLWGIAFALTFALAPAEMNEAFWGRWLPFLIRNEDYFYSPLKDIAWRGLPALPFYIPLTLVSLPVCLAISRMFSFGARLEVEALVVATLAAYGMFLVQHRGWPYQLYPMVGFSFLLAGSMAMAVIEPASMFAKPPLKDRTRLRSALLVLSCAALIAGSGLVATHRLMKRATVRAESDPFVELIEQYSSVDETIVWMSPNLNPAIQTLIYTKRLPGSRYSAMWPLTMTYKNIRRSGTGAFPYRAISEAPEEERLILRDLGNDIMNHKPRLIFIHAVDAPLTRPRGFIMEDYLRENGWMIQHMSKYAFLAALNGYSVYRRTD